MIESGADSVQRRIGIFGGSFDPVHLGHLILAQSALEHFGLQEVCFMPCADQPLKRGLACADAGSRRDMLDAAIEGNPFFRLLDIELQRGGISYAVDSLRTLHTQWPDCAFTFLIGADTLAELHHWYKIEELGRLCRFGVFGRPGPSRVSASDLPLGVEVEYAGASRMIDISSTDIRRRVAEGLSIRYLVPDCVQMMIMERHLYQ